MRSRSRFRGLARWREVEEAMDGRKQPAGSGGGGGGGGAELAAGTREQAAVSSVLQFYRQAYQ